jgi:ubiquitin C-terminal hydrolase
MNPFREGNTNNSEYIEYLNQAALLRIAEKKRKEEKLPENHEITINRSELERFIETSMIKSLSEIANTIIYKGNSEVVPQHFKRLVDYKIPILRGFSQQDAHELLINLLDIITDETGIESEPEINNIPEAIRELISFLADATRRIKSVTSIEEKRSIIEEANRYKKQYEHIYQKYEGLSYMKRIFKTRYNPLIFKMKTFISQTKQCNQCGDKSCIFENTPVISLDIPEGYIQTGCTLDNCFESMINPEQIDYKCQICENTKATRKSLLWRPGMFLFVHLKRFRIMPNGRILKINTPVEIPFEFDISKFSDTSMLTERNISYRYTLKGYINHFGGYSGGHYTADCVSLTNDSIWYNFNDANVSKYRGNDLNTSSAYIMMYEITN